ncbi:MAG: serine hydrolase domain-containing protein [Pseudomonadales bacterium]
MSKNGPFLSIFLLPMLCVFVACAPVEPRDNRLATEPSAELSRELGSFEGKDANAILFLQGEQQVQAFRHSSVLAPTRRVEASSRPLPLRAAKAGASKAITDLKFDFGGRSISLDEFMTEKRVAGLIVIKDGEVKYEKYGLGGSAESRWISFSVSKSVVSMLIGAAIKDGYIGDLDDKVVNYLPQLKDSSYEQTSIRDLLQMASGVEWNEDYADPNSDVAGANYETLALYEHLRRKPVAAKPGEKFNYNTAETNLAGTLLRSAIGNNLSTYLQEKIWQPFGMESDAYWQLTEPGGGEFGGCCINATLRDYARIGLFALSNGELQNGENVLPPGWMSESTTPSKGFDGYGYFWWLSEDGSYQASGIFGQGIYINPATSTVIAVHSAWEAADSEADWSLLETVFGTINNSMK